MAKSPERGRVEFEDPTFRSSVFSGSPPPPDPRFSVRKESEVLSLTLYDTVNYPAYGTFSLRWFSVPLGGTATLIRTGANVTVSKTYGETNLLHAGIILGHDVEIRALSLLPKPLGSPVESRDEIVRLIDAGAFDLRLCDKPYVSVDLACLMPDWWNEVASERDRPGWLRDYTEVWSAYRFQLDTPLIIPRNTPFSAEATFNGMPELRRTVDLRLRLHGFRHRPIQ